MRSTPLSSSVWCCKEKSKGDQVRFLVLHKTSLLFQNSRVVYFRQTSRKYIELKELSASKSNFDKKRRVQGVLNLTSDKKISSKNRSQYTTDSVTTAWAIPGSIRSYVPLGLSAFSALCFSAMLCGSIRTV